MSKKFRVMRPTSGLHHALMSDAEKYRLLQAERLLSNAGCEPDDNGAWRTYRTKPM